MTHSEPPSETDRWTVAVAGAVTDPRTVRATDLAALASVPVEASTACGEEAVPTRQWSGVRVGMVLDRAKPRSNASHALVRSADADFACGFDLERLREGLLAVRLDGEPIPTERGGPVRLVFADADCWERVKWVSRIDVLDEPPGEDDTARDLVTA
ncbi:MAG: molybdopterin-dependent oxidoreductase [Haloplanus sp.]